MRLRVVLACALVLVVVVLGLPASAAHGVGGSPSRRAEAALPEGFRPAILAPRGLGRYFVEIRTPSLGDRSGASLAPAGQRRAVASALESQEAAIGEVRSLGGTIVFRYARLVNAFSAQMSASAAAELARRADVARVEPVPIVVKLNETSVPFIGAPKVWKKLGVQGQGMTVAVVDTGVDYTHADFGGPGTVAAYTANDPSIIEPGTFPTAKVIGGYDFVGAGYDVLDSSTKNDLPVPDPDPLDAEGHGTHVAGTCCGIGVPGIVGKGVAPKAKILAVKVWDTGGNSTADVLVAGYEFAVDPNGDGSTRDAADVLSFSGGVDYGAGSSIEAKAAKAVVRLGTVFVAAAGNAGNQPNGGSGYILGTPAAARSVIAVGASIDQFSAQKLTVNTPSGVRLPDGGPIVRQDWAAPFTSDITGGVVDARQYSPVADPNGAPAPTDRMLCDSVPPGNPFGGKIALVFKGPFGAGDCTADDKVLNAQNAGAVAVILWDGFGGLPAQYAPGTSAGKVTIPAVSLSGKDSAALAAALSPDAPASYNTVPGNVTLGATASVIPGYADRMTDFSSEGPARITSDLKPDVSAPGQDITSAAVGTGNGAITFSGTSMATPHVSGVATLLRQIHPTWPPEKIKALIMNQATLAIRNLDGTKPVAATIMGSGRVQAFESAITTNLATPGSLSFGLRPVHSVQSMVKRITVANNDSGKHRYTATAHVRFTDFAKGFSDVQVRSVGGGWSHSLSFELGAGKSTAVEVRLTLDPGAVLKWQQEWGWYYWNPNIDGNVSFAQTDGAGDAFHVPWHVAALAVARSGLSRPSLAVAGGSKTMTLTGGGAGVPYADLYLLGARSPRTDGSEADIAAVGARSFTGTTIDGTAEGVPAGGDPYGGNKWLGFLTNGNEPTEPVEFGVWTYGVRNTTESQEIDVLVDVGADGVFADKKLGGDVLIVKPPGTGEVCVFKLPSTFATCDFSYFPDYSNYNSSVTGLAVDAGALGLSDSNHALSYQVTACTGAFSGDVPAATCDTVGDIDPVTGTYGPRIDLTQPALSISPLVCRGFWAGGACDASRPIKVSVGSAAAGENPGILALFPNNAPSSSQGTIVKTTT